VNPKKHREFKKDISERLNIHPDVVDDFIAFYYDTLRRELSNLTAVHIYVNNLGTFSLKKQKLEKGIKKNKDILGNLTKRTYKGMEKSQAVNEKLKQQENALKMLNESIQNKLDFKKKKDGSK
jgi:nucleoid DNA-binding protein